MRNFLLSVTLVTTSCAVDQSFRATAPSAGPESPLVIPTAERATLDNGLELFVLRSGEVPLIHAELVTKSGSAQDPSNMPGLAGFMGAMLTSGTEKRSAIQIAAEVETLGTQLSVSVGEDATTVSTTALSKNFDQVFEVMADVLTGSTFAAEEIDRIRSRRLASLTRSHDEPGFLAEKAFRATVYGDHPYAHPVIGKEETLKKVNRKDLRAFFHAHMHPKNAALILVGDITMDQARAVADKHLGDWKAVNATRITDTKVADTGGHRVVVDRPDAPQTELRIGHLTVARSHPDYFALVLCNGVLGGQFQSRINQNLRKDKGYTYGAYSRIRFRRDPGPFVVSTAVQSEVTVPAVKEVLKEVTTIREDSITEHELAQAKSAYTNSLPGRFESIASIGSMMANLFIYDLPNTYYRDLSKNLAAVTLDDVKRVAKEHLRPEDLNIILVGDKKVIESQWADMGEFKVQPAAM